MKRIINASNVVKAAELLSQIEPSQVQSKQHRAPVLIASFKTVLSEFRQPLVCTTPPIEQLDAQLNNLIKVTQALFNHLEPTAQDEILKKIQQDSVEKTVA